MTAVFAAPRRARFGVGEALDEDRDLQHQQRDAPAAEPAGMAARVGAGCGLPAGAEERRTPAFPRRPSGMPATGRSGGDSGPGTALRSSHGAERPSWRATSCPAIRRTRQSRYIEAAVSGMLIACLYLPNGNPAARTQVRLQARLVRAADRACGRAVRDRRAGGARRRLQRRADRSGHLPDQIVGPGRAAPARKPGGVRAPSRPGLDRCDPHPAPIEAHLHLLGL